MELQSRFQGFKKDGIFHCLLFSLYLRYHTIKPHVYTTSLHAYICSLFVYTETW